jgi:hypothetical protein
MQAGDYVQLAHRVSWWPRKTRGEITEVLPDGWYRILTSTGTLEAREDDLIRILRRSEIGRR